MRIVHRYIPERHVKSFLTQGLHFSRCNSFVDLLEFRLGYCSWETGCEGWPELRNCVEATFRDDAVNRVIAATSISCWTETSEQSDWPWVVYGKQRGAIRVSMEVSELARHVWRSGIPGYEGFVIYDFMPDQIFPQFPKAFNNPTREQTDKHHLFFHKHGFYSYEAEYRIILFKDGASSIPLPDDLVRRVTISPFQQLGGELTALLKSRFGQRLRLFS